MSRGVALFDLDHTLTRQDSFPMWIAILVGWRRTLRAFAMAGFAVRPGRSDLRGRAKEAILRWSIRGATLAAAQAAGRLLGQRLRWRESRLTALNAHRAAGCRRGNAGDAHPCASRRDVGLLCVGGVTAALATLWHRGAPWSCPTRKIPASRPTILLSTGPGSNAQRLGGRTIGAQLDEVERCFR